MTILIDIVVVAWLLFGATLLFLYIHKIKRLQKIVDAQQKQLSVAINELDSIKHAASDLRIEFATKFGVHENNNLLISKLVDVHKTETTKMFETITEAFEFVNNERNLMIKDLAEIKRRVRMTSNETKRQTHQQRHYTNPRSV